MTISLQLKEFFYSLRASDKYSDFDSRKSFNRINKPESETLLLGASHTNDSVSSLSKTSSLGSELEGVHEVRLAWRHIKKWLHRYSEDINNSLLNPCTDTDISEFEKDLGCHFPTCVREFFRLTDGQSTFNDNGCCGLFYGLRLMPIDEIAVMTESWHKVHVSILQKTENRGLQEYAADAGFAETDLSVAAGFKKRTTPIIKERNEFPDQDLVPPNTVFRIYAHSQWIPLITDSSGSFIGIDLSPGTAEHPDIADGKWGQVILFGRDFDTKYKIADTLGDFLLIFANDLEKGNWELRSSSDNEDMVSGVDAELVYVDHETKKELPYLRVLKERAFQQWLSSLSEKDLLRESNLRLIQKIQEKQPLVQIPQSTTDIFLQENMSNLDAVAADNMAGNPAPKTGP